MGSATLSRRAASPAGGADPEGGTTREHPRDTAAWWKVRPGMPLRLWQIVEITAACAAPIPVGL